MATGRAPTASAFTSFAKCICCSIEKTRYPMARNLTDTSSLHTPVTLCDDVYFLWFEPSLIAIHSIQPPSTIHEVYTPTPSVTTGGHFYTYNSLHFTECSRIYDIHTRDCLTNNIHNGVTQTMVMMMAALPLFPNIGKTPPPVVWRRNADPK